MASFETTISVKTKIKVIFLGDTAVGKSSIIAAMRDEPFREEHEATVGIDFFSKVLIGQRQQYKLQFWDTAGQQRFRSIIPSYIRNAQVGMIVYDVGNRTSFESVNIWVDLFREYSPEDSTIIMIGNKIDNPQRAVNSQQGIDKAEDLKIEYLQMSAKTSQGMGRADSMLLHVLESGNFDPDAKSERSVRQIEVHSPSKKTDFKGLFREKRVYQQCCYV